MPRSPSWRSAWLGLGPGVGLGLGVGVGVGLGLDGVAADEVELEHAMVRHLP